MLKETYLSAAAKTLLVVVQQEELPIIVAIDYLNGMTLPDGALTQMLMTVKVVKRSPITAYWLLQRWDKSLDLGGG